MDLPVIKKWDARNRRQPAYYIDNSDRCITTLRQTQSSPENISRWNQSSRKESIPLSAVLIQDKNCVKYVERMFEWYPSIWEGIGKLLLHRAEFSMLTNGEQARPNHPALFLLYESAADKNLPVQIHSDMRVKRLKKPIYLYELEEATSAFPKNQIYLVTCRI